MKQTGWQDFKENMHGLFPYLVAAAIYIPIAVWQPRFMLNWTPAYILLLLVIWTAPATWRKWRRR